MSRGLTRAAGGSFVALILVAELLKGDSPSPTGPADEIVTFFTDHRSTILAGAYVQMLALFVFALIFCRLADGLMPAGAVAGKLARLGLVLTLAAYTSCVFLTAALAFGAGADATPANAKALWEIRFVSETFLNFPVALLIGSVAVAIGPELSRRWFRWGSAALSAAFLVGGAALARNGFFAPDGGYGFILFWLLPLWVAVTACLAPARDQGSLPPRTASTAAP